MGSFASHNPSVDWVGAWQLMQGQQSCQVQDSHLANKTRDANSELGQRMRG